MLAPIPLDQSARLAAIRRYDLGAGVHAASFEGLTELAAQVCDCPIALVSIVRESDQVFESACGLDIESTDLGSSVCSHAILEDGILEIPDMRLDVRTSDNPLVTDREDPKIFYAGAQIRTEAGIALGSLCVLDRKPRRLGDKQRRALRILADQVMRRLELHESLRQQDVLRREVDHRVKNNLANVAVLARMAARNAEGQEAKDAISAVEQRIHVMVELHSELYGQPGGGGNDCPIEMSAFLRRIVGHLRGIAPEKVRIEADFEPFHLKSRRASALGVLVNELASNACKHAFKPDGSGGLIRLEGRALTGGRYLLTCKDDGHGGPSDAPGGRLPKSKGLGLKIARASAAQLDATLEIGPAAQGWCGLVDFLPDQA